MGGVARVAPPSPLLNEPMSYQGKRRLGVRCQACNVRLNTQNRGKRSPYWCAPCDERRIKRISGQFKEISESMGMDPSCSTPDESKRMDVANDMSLSNFVPAERSETIVLCRPVPTRCTLRRHETTTTNMGVPTRWRG